VFTFIERTESIIHFRYFIESIIDRGSKKSGSSAELWVVLIAKSMLT